MPPIYFMSFPTKKKNVPEQWCRQDGLCYSDTAIEEKAIALFHIGYLIYSWWISIINMKAIFGLRWMKWGIHLTLFLTYRSYFTFSMEIPFFPYLISIWFNILLIVHSNYFLFRIIAVCVFFIMYIYTL